MKVVKLRLKKDGREKLLDGLSLIEGLGVEGDEKALKKGGDAKVILADEGELVRYREEKKGLCVGRFRPHILTEGLDYSTVIPGIVLKIGNAKLEITGVSKKCFPECDFVKKGTTCNIKYNCAVARVSESGTVASGDLIFYC